MGNLHEEAVEVFDLLEDDYDAGAYQMLGRHQVPMQSQRALSYALTGPFKKEAKQLMKFSSQMSYAEVSEIYKLAEKVVNENIDPYSHPFFDNYYQKSKRAFDYFLGKEIEVKFDPDLLGWKYGDRSQFTVESDNAIVIDNRLGPMQYYLAADIEIGPSTEIDYEFEIIRNEKKNSYGLFFDVLFTPSLMPINNKGWGFSFGFSQGNPRKNVFRGHKKYQYDGNGRFAFGSYHREKGGLFSYSLAANAAKNVVKIRYAPGYFEAYMNDKLVCRSNLETIANLPRPIVFGQPRNSKGRGRVRISNVRYKRWSKGNLKLADEQGTIGFYERVVKAAPKDKWSNFWLAHALHRTGEYEKAIEIYNKAIELGVTKFNAGFYLGDCYDQLGKTDKAIEWYTHAANFETSNNAISGYEVLERKSPSNESQWAAFRLHWFRAIGLTENFADENFCDPNPPIECQWGMDLLECYRLAKSKRFEKAEELARSCLAKCNVEQEEFVLRMIESYKNNKVFTPKNEKPFYLSFDKPIPFFRLFEDVVPAKWNRKF